MESKTSTIGVLSGKVLERCVRCNHAKWVNEGCTMCFEIITRDKLIEADRRRKMLNNIRTIERKLRIVKSNKGKKSKCIVCNKGHSRHGYMTCSRVCTIRMPSIVYGAKGKKEVKMSVQDAIKKLYKDTNHG